MAGKEVAPLLALDSFSCPHCGALAHQHAEKENRKEEVEALVNYHLFSEFALMRPTADYQTSPQYAFVWRCAARPQD
jgi:hypothetical protein